MTTNETAHKIRQTYITGECCYSGDVTKTRWQATEYVASVDHGVERLIHQAFGDPVRMGFLQSFEMYPTSLSVTNMIGTGGKNQIVFYMQGTYVKLTA